MSIKWVKTARHGGSVQRTHTVPTIQKHYSNAEHTFNAIIIAKQICKDLDYHVAVGDVSEEGDGAVEPIGEDVIVTYLLKHDLAESYTGDMPANLKKETDIKALLDRIEEQWERDNVPEEYISDDMTSVELWIAKMADSLELGMFCIDDYKMGNRHDIFLYMVNRIDRYVIDQISIFPGLASDLKTVIAIRKELCKCL